MRKIVMAIVACWCSLSALVAAPLQPVDRIIAIVNNGVITHSEFVRQEAFLQHRLEAMGVNLPPKDQLDAQVLQQMINTKLQVQFAQETGMTVSSTQINEAVDKAAKSSHLSVSELYDQAASFGFTRAEFRQELADEVLVEMVQERDVASRITISDREIDDYINIAQTSARGSAEYHVRDILIALPAQPTADQIAAAQQKAAAVIQALNSGKSFASLAVAQSSGEKALEGGDLGWRRLAQLPDVFAATIENMKQGQVAGPIRTPNGFHIIQLLGEKSANLPSNTEERRQFVASLLFQRQFQQEYITWLSGLRAAAYIKVLS